MMKKKEPAYTDYVPRDVSWMYFNRRILQEAMKPTVPLLERLGFLGIYSNNLDEFFRVRVALLNRIAACDDKETRDDRHEALSTLKVINRLNAHYSKEYETAIHQVEEELRKENICIVNEEELNDEQHAFVRDFYYKQFDGFIAPVWFSALKDLTEQPDDCIYMAVKMRRESDKSHPEYALLQLPISLVGRFVRLPDKDGNPTSCTPTTWCVAPCHSSSPDSTTPTSKPTLSSSQRMRKWKSTTTSALASCRKSQRA